MCNFKLSFFSRSSKETPAVPVRQRGGNALRESRPGKENCDSRPENMTTLISEGYERHSVQRALTTANNNLDLARAILRDFVPKS